MSTAAARNRPSQCRSAIPAARVGPYDWIITVSAVTERRGSPRDAQLLYDESPEGRVARERLAEAHKIAPAPAYRGKGRPTKKDRRELQRLEDGDL